MAKIVFFELEGWGKEIIEKNLQGHELILLNKKLSDTIIDKVKNVEIISVFIYSRIMSDMLEKLPSLKGSPLYMFDYWFILVPPWSVFILPRGGFHHRPLGNKTSTYKID